MEVDLTPLLNVEAQLARNTIDEAETSNISRPLPLPATTSSSNTSIENEEPQRVPPTFGQDRMKSILLILQYEQVFPQVVKPITEGIRVRELDDVSAEGLLKEIRLAVCCKNGVKIGPQVVEAVLAVFESILLEYSPFKVEGLHLASRDPDYVDVINEIMLEMGGLTYTHPWVRLLLLTVKHGYICHQINTTMTQNLGDAAQVQESLTKMGEEAEARRVNS